MGVTSKANVGNTARLRARDRTGSTISAGVMAPSKRSGNGPGGEAFGEFCFRPASDAYTGKAAMIKYDKTAPTGALNLRHIAGVALVAILMLHGARSAYATNAYYYADPNDGFENLLEKYPNWSDAYRCAACHFTQSSTTADLNPFGQTFQANKSLTAIAGLNSDGDGLTNGDELANNLLPGYKTPAPTGVSASDGTFGDKVRITWNAVANPGVWQPSWLVQLVKYEIHRDKNPTVSVSLLVTVGPTTTSYDDTSAAPPTPPIIFTYYIKAIGPGGETNMLAATDTGRRATGAEVKVAKVPSEAPGAAAVPGTSLTQIIVLRPPRGVKASDGTFLDKVRVTWNAVPGASSYQVFRASSSGGSRKLKLGSTSGTTRDDTTAVAGTTYAYSVTACGATNKCGVHSATDTGFKKKLVLAPPVAKRTSPVIKPVAPGIKTTLPARKVAPTLTTRPSTERKVAPPPTARPSTEREEAPASAERVSPTIKVVPRN